jgi:type VI secretion system ImpM family protein
VIAGAPFLFGKLPAYGDFVAARLEAADREAWDARCTAALTAAADRFGDALDAALEAVPTAGFVLANNGGCWQAGCVAPSCDRAGRDFLFVLGATGAEPSADDGRTVAARLAPCLQAAIADRLDIEAILTRAATALSEPDIANDHPPIMIVWYDDWLADIASDAIDERNGR